MVQIRFLGGGIFLEAFSFFHTQQRFLTLPPFSTMVLHPSVDGLFLAFSRKAHTSLQPGCKTWHLPIVDFCLSDTRELLCWFKSVAGEAPTDCCLEVFPFCFAFIKLTHTNTHTSQEREKHKLTHKKIYLKKIKNKKNLYENYYLWHVGVPPTPAGDFITETWDFRMWDLLSCYCIFFNWLILNHWPMHQTCSYSATNWQPDIMLLCYCVRCLKTCYCVIMLDVWRPVWYTTDQEGPPALVEDNPEEKLFFCIQFFEDSRER